MFTRESMIEYPVFMEDISLCHAWHAKIDNRLRSIGMMLYRLTSTLNSRQSVAEDLQPVPFQDTLLWIEYRLLDISVFQNPPGLESMLRHAMLAFMTGWISSYGTARYDFLADQLRQSLLSMSEESSPLFLWTLFVGAITVFTVDDHHWLVPKLSRTLRKLALQDWESVRRYLASLAWVHLIHDKPAKNIWREASLHQAYHRLDSSSLGDTPFSSAGIIALS